MESFLESLSRGVAELTGLAPDACYYAVLVTIALAVVVIALAVLGSLKCFAEWLAVPKSFEEAQPPATTPAPEFWGGRCVPHEMLKYHFAYSPGRRRMADAAQILQCVIQNEIKLIAGLPEDLRNCNSCLCKHYHHSDFPDPDPTRSCPSNFSETIQRAVEVHEHVRDRLSNSRVRVLSESAPQPEPEPLQPEAPKANRVPIQPPRQQASCEPRPLPRPNLLVVGTR